MRFFMFFGLLVVFFGCGVIDQNVKARTSLAKCRYSLEDFTLQELEFSPWLLVQGQEVDLLSVRSLPVLLAHKDQIKLDNVRLKVDSVAFDLVLKIENTTSHPVVLDHVDAELFLDDKFITQFQHKNFVRINPGKFSNEKISLSIPFSHLAGITEKRPLKAGVKAKVFINILLGDFTLKTPFEVTVNKTFPIPYDKLEKKLEQEKEKTIDKIDDLIKKAVKEGTNKLLKKIF